MCLAVVWQLHASIHSIRLPIDTIPLVIILFTLLALFTLLHPEKELGISVFGEFGSTTHEVGATAFVAASWLTSCWSFCSLVDLGSFVATFVAVVAAIVVASA